MSKQEVLCLFRTLQKDLYNLSQSNGAGEWRKREAQALSDLVQRRIHYLQVHVPSNFQLPGCISPEGTSVRMIELGGNGVLQVCSKANGVAIHTGSYL